MNMLFLTYECTYVFVLQKNTKRSEQKRMKEIWNVHVLIVEQGTLTPEIRLFFIKRLNKRIFGVKVSCSTIRT